VREQRSASSQIAKEAGDAVRQHQEVTPMKLHSVARLALALPLLGSPAAAPLQPGVQQVKEGDFETALLTLDQAIREISAQPPSPARDRELAQAHLYRGVAYLQLDQAILARSSFVAALAREKTLTLSPDEFPPKVLRAFESARTAYSESGKLASSAKKKGHRTALIITGVGVAVGGAAALALGPLSKERTNSPPTARIAGWQPSGKPIAEVTRVTFSGDGSDPDGEPVSLAWNFGCGGGSGTGPSATTVFQSAGDCIVTLTATDGLGGVGTTQTTVSVGSLLATWLPLQASPCGLTRFQVQRLNDSGRTPILSCADSSGQTTYCTGGSTTNPRGLRFEHHIVDSGTYLLCEDHYVLEVSANIDSMSGTVTCTYAGPSTRYSAGQTVSVTFVRQ
jgi:hypothetical protein